MPYGMTPHPALSMNRVDQRLVPRLKNNPHLTPSVAAAAMEGRPALSPSRFADSYAGRGEGE
jgi:hypothetical protein